jgi:hypothetical protein
MTAEQAYEAIERDFESATTRAAISGLSRERRALLRRYWIDRATGEATTALTFEFMLDDLTERGAPRALVDLARRAIADERLHTDWCIRWADALEPDEPARPRLSGTQPLTFPRASSDDNRLLRTVFGCCFSETVAVHVLLASHARIEWDCVRRLNQQHLREEVGHARLGWGLLGWPGVSARDREMIGSYVPEMIQLTRKVWQTRRRDSDEELHRAGYLSSVIVDPACDDALDNVVLPGLTRLGIPVERSASGGS